jgi:autotransporter-associated beta strand protein
MNRKGGFKPPLRIMAPGGSHSNPQIILTKNNPMKPRSNPLLHISAAVALACAGTVHAADVTLSTGTYTDIQSYDNGTLGPGNANVVTFDSGANYTFSGNLTLPGAWNHINLNSGASLNVGGSLTADISGVSLNGGTLTTGGLYLHDSPNWNGTLNDGKQTIEYGDSVINGSTIIANQSNANFISMAGGVGAANGWVGNWLQIGSDGATIDSNGFDIGNTMNTWGSGGLTKDGEGTLTLSASNYFSGNTTVNGGTLQLGASSASNPQDGYLESSSLLTINSGATVRAMGANAFKGWSGGSMDVTLNGGTLTINDGVTEGGNHSLGNVILNGGEISGVGSSVYGGFNLNGTLTVTNDSTISVSHLNTGNGNRTVDVATGKTLTWSGEISNGSAVGTTSLTFTGAGTTVMSATNSYTGPTTVSAGTLYVTGALSGSAVTVEANGTIGSNGAAGGLGNGLTIQSGGNLDLTNATIALNSTGILSLTGGSLTLGHLTFEDLVGWDWANAAVGTYELIDGNFTINWGTTAYTSAATAYDFLNGKKGYFTSGSLNVVIIPEPGAALLGGIGMLALLRRRR